MKAVNYKEFGTLKREPKEFACRSIGNDCGWKHVARTEELLLDEAAIHLRDVHGLQALGVDMLGKIKRSFTNPSTSAEPGSETPVMRELRCRDMGMDCNWRYIAQTEELIVDGAAIHARDVHGISEFTPEMIANVKKSIRVWGNEKAAA